MRRVIRGSEAYQTGATSYETYFENLQHGSVISSEKKIEDEKADIQDNPNRIPGADGGTAPAKAGAAGNEKPKGE